MSILIFIIFCIPKKNDHLNLNSIPSVFFSCFSRRTSDINRIYQACDTPEYNHVFLQALPVAFRVSCCISLQISRIGYKSDDRDVHARICVRTSEHHLRNPPLCKDRILPAASKSWRPSHNRYFCLSFLRHHTIPEC